MALPGKSAMAKLLVSNAGGLNSERRKCLIIFVRFVVLYIKPFSINVIILAIKMMCECLKYAKLGCICWCIQESVIKNGYALIIQNSRYKTKDIGSSISSIVMDDFFRDNGFKTHLCTEATAAVMICFMC